MQYTYFPVRAKPLKLSWKEKSDEEAVEEVRACIDTCVQELLRLRNKQRNIFIATKFGEIMKENAYLKQKCEQLGDELEPARKKLEKYQEDESQGEDDGSEQKEEVKAEDSSEQEADKEDDKDKSEDSEGDETPTEERNWRT